MTEQSIGFIVGVLLLSSCGPGEGRAPPESSARPGAVAAQGAGAPHKGVLQVGTWHGRKGAFATIQSAVDAAVSGDWILIAPGDYHEAGTNSAGVSIVKAGLHLRGLDRNRVVVDGTKAGTKLRRDALHGSSPHEVGVRRARAARGGGARHRSSAAHARAGGGRQGGGGPLQAVAGRRRQRGSHGAGDLGPGCWFR